MLLHSTPIPRRATTAARREGSRPLAAPRAAMAVAVASPRRAPALRRHRAVVAAATPFGGGAAPSFPEPPSRAAPAKPSSPPATDPSAATEPTVEELMDPHAPVLREDMPLREAARVFLTTSAQSAPVVDASGLLVGVLSESDLILKSSGVPADEHWLLPPVYVGILDATFALRDEAAWKAEVEKLLARDVSHAMTGAGGKAGRGGGKKKKGSDGDALVTARPDEAVSVAAGRMAKRRVNMLPVVDGGGQVVGTLTRHDVLRGLYATQNPML